MNDVERFTADLQRFRAIANKKRADLQQALEAVVSAEQCVALAAERLDRAKDKAEVRALLRRDWAVRVLDAWCGGTGGRTVTLGTNHSVFLTDPDNQRLFAGPGGTLYDNGDTARLAAAEAAVNELPESVRAKLGAKP